MKKCILTYVVACIALILTHFTVYRILGSIGLVTFVVINLVLPSVIIMIANAVINYGKGGTIKKCLLHAVILAALSLAINLGTTQIMGNNAVENLIASEGNTDEADEGADQEIMDELDRQARQKMIDEGLISEDEEIYSEPYGNSEKIDGTDKEDGSDQQLTGTWDVQIEEENPLSTATGAILDILLAFLGGMIGLKIGNKKSLMKENRHGFGY